MCAKQLHAPPPRLPDPPSLVEVEEKEDATADIEAELLWQSQPLPPRGDVPNRWPFLDSGDGQPQDRATPSYSRVHYRQLLGTGKTGSTGHSHGGVTVSAALIQSSVQIFPVVYLSNLHSVHPKSSVRFSAVMDDKSPSLSFGR